MMRIPRLTAKHLLYLSLAVNLGILIIFKYYDFFVLSFQEAFAGLGIHLNVRTLNVILPLGISFYTFQTLSYTIDIYRKHLQPTDNFVNFFAYVSFFPQLVAGPIERAASLLPQFETERKFDRDLSTDGLRQILWGFFKKMVIADNIGVQVDQIFATYTDQSAPTLFLGMMMFSIQLYADFSGYSDIAVGTGKLFGFRLMTNFRAPIFSKSIPDFWSRWHISMTTWFRDYLYKPMAARFNRGRLMSFVTIIVLFLVIGLWHGANWTFIAYGLCNGLYFIPNVLKRQNMTARKALRKLYSAAYLVALMTALTFILNSLTVVFFRSPDIKSSIGYMVHLFINPKWLVPNPDVMKIWFFYIIPFVIFEWMQRDYEHQFDIRRYPTWLRFTLYYLLIFLIILFANFGKPPFIYFQF